MDIYQKTVEDFTAWLSTLGYSESSVYSIPKQVKEFLEWLEEQHIRPEEIRQRHAKEFIDHFQHRPNQRRKGGLSIAHINKQIDAMNKLSKYLKVTQQSQYTFHLKQLKSPEKPQRIVLSKTQIQALYQAAEEDEIGRRDKAMLGIYYGCGLRKGEGLALEVDDILFESQLLYVRKPKNGEERYVPIPLKVLQDLEVYLSQARPLLLNDLQPTESLFISQRGSKMSKESMVARLNTLKEKAGFTQKFGLHALRHSWAALRITTHLLQSGMSLENIAAFLGHKTLDSTQHYTHLIK